MGGVVFKPLRDYDLEGFNYAGIIGNPEIGELIYTNSSKKLIDIFDRTCCVDRNFPYFLHP